MICLPHLFDFPLFREIYYYTLYIKIEKKYHYFIRGIYIMESSSNNTTIIKTPNGDFIV